MAKPGFYNDNLNRAYPLVFCPGKLFRDCDGVLLDLPDNTFVDFGALMGLDSQYVADEHDVYLHKICRSGDYIYFDFRSTAPGTFNRPLVFTRLIAGEDYITEDVDDTDDTSPCSLQLSDDSIASEVSADPPISESSADSASSAESMDSSFVSDDCFEDPAWSGYLVTGNLDKLVEILPPGCTLTATPGEVLVEPALVRSLVGHYVRTLNLANDDRTRADAPEGCPELEYPYPTGQTYIQAECLFGQPRLKPGYNTVITQDNFSNRIDIAASVGAGEGEPCEEVELFDAEVPPDGKTTLDGASRCNEVLRSLNGVGGRILNLRTGIGATILNLPELNKIVINVDMNGLAVCFSGQSDDPDQSFDSC